MELVAFAALVNRIDALLRRELYHPCVLLVHPEIPRLRRVTEQLENHYGWSTLSVGSELSEALLPVAPKRRPFQAQQAFTKALSRIASSPVLCIDIDLLFEPSLQLDPLRLFRDGSRLLQLVATWPGQFRNGILSYAVPEHSHHRVWTRPGLCEGCIIPL